MSNKNIVANKKNTAGKKNEPEVKTRKVPAGLNKIKQDLQNARKIKEEEERKTREEEEKLEKLKQLKEEEEKQKKEKRDKENQKRKEKKELEKKLGTYKTVKEKCKMKETRAKYGIDPNSSRQGGNDVVVKKPVVYHNKKKQQKKKEQNESDGKKTEDEIENHENKIESKDETNNHSNDSKLDDWENMMSSDDEKSGIDSVKDKSTKAIEIRKTKENTLQKEIRQHYESRFQEEADPLVLTKLRIQQRREECERQKKESTLRAPIVCVLGHVDTGKTKILDKLRHTDVQGGEAGGITQQIGATNVPLQDIPSILSAVPDLRLPGLLIIDTPGHESFSNMRMRGSSLCDIAVLVVDLMHGVQEQTKESIRLLQKGKMPFVVALNKIDRLINWKPDPTRPIKEVMESQTNRTKADFRDRLNQTIAHFANVELNVRCFWENDDDDEQYVNMVPTSAHTGDGMDDLIAYICKYSQNKLPRRLAFSEELQASVMEVKETEGHGTTLDVILVNGRLRTNDLIVVGGQEGPISTRIRYLLKVNLAGFLLCIFLLYFGLP